MNNHLFIINPFAGNGNYTKIETEIRRFQQSREDIFVMRTEYQGHCDRILKEYLPKGIRRVYMVGGDGSLNELLNVVMNQNLANELSIGVIPTGSGNDYIRNFTEFYDISKIKNLSQYLMSMIHCETIDIDIGKINQKYFWNIVSMGLDAEVIKNSYLFKKNLLIPRQLAYFSSALYTMIDIKNYPLKVFIDQQQTAENFLMISIGKGKYYGSGMKALPNADICDEQMDICMVKPMKRRRMLALMKKFIQGNHEGLPEVSMTQSKEIHIVADKKIPFQFDGELGYATEFEIRVLPKAIRFIKPL